MTYTSSHNFGLTVIEEGLFDDANKTISLESIDVGRTSMNKSPNVLKVNYFHLC